MFNYSSDNSLHKYIEKGLGENVLCIFTYKSQNIDFDKFQSAFGKKFKLNLYGVDIDTNLDKLVISLSNTINRMIFSSYLIMDYPAFCLLTNTFQRVNFNESQFKEVIIFDPNNSKSKLINLLGENILNEFKSIETTMDFLSNSKIQVISITNNPFSLKVASKFDQTKITCLTNYSEFIELLQNKFGDK
jgi:hypothetical protein